MKDLDLDIIAAKIARQVLLEEMDLEKEKQDAIAGEIKKSDLKAEPSKKDSTEKRLTDEAEDDEAEDDEEEIKAKPKPDSGSDDEDDESFEVESDVADIPKNVNFDEVKKQINNLRAGGSLKDEQISDQLKDYFDKLGKAETKALYVYLSSVASILTGGTPGAEAPRPSDADIDLSIKKRKRKKLARQCRASMARALKLQSLSERELIIIQQK